MNFKPLLATIMVVLFPFSAIAHDSSKEYMSAEEVRQSLIDTTFTEYIPGNRVNTITVVPGDPENLSD